MGFDLETRRYELNVYITFIGLNAKRFRFRPISIQHMNGFVYRVLIFGKRRSQVRLLKRFNSDIKRTGFI